MLKNLIRIFGQLSSKRGFSKIFRIEEVIRITGISKQSLHAWERRYGAISSARTSSNRRLFSQDDLGRLILLKKCIDQGHRIGTIFNYDTQELKKLVSRDTKINRNFEDIIERLKMLDKDGVDKILIDRFLLLGPSNFAIEFVTPLLRTIGELYEAGDISITSEHMFSQAARSILGSALRPVRGREYVLSAMFCTPEGDVHELGTLVAALLAQEAGIGVHYFGAQLPIQEICNSANQIGVQAVCVGSACLSSADLVAWTKALRSALPGKIDLWVGGAGFAAIANDLPDGTRMFYCLEDLESYVQIQTVIPRAAQ